MALRCVNRENTEETWLKLFMLLKCVLPSIEHGGGGGGGGGGAMKSLSQ